MMKAKLHDDWVRLGARGSSYDLKDDGRTVVMRADGRELHRTRHYRLDKVYAQLVQDAYARGLKQLPLY